VLSRLEAGGVIPTILLLDRISVALEADSHHRVCSGRRIGPAGRRANPSASEQQTWDQCSCSYLNES